MNYQRAYRFCGHFRDSPASSYGTCTQAALRIGHSYFVTATAMSYTGSLLSRKRYLPMSVRAAAESIASLPTRFLSKYGVASRPWIQYNFTFVYTHGEGGSAPTTTTFDLSVAAFVFDDYHFFFPFA